MAGTKERMAGKAMEWEGKATGDPVREMEGKALSNVGRLKGKTQKAKDTVRGKSPKLKS